MNESDAMQASESKANAGVPASRRTRNGLPLFRILLSGIVLTVALLSLVWWRGELQTPLPTATLIPTQWAAAAPTATPRPTATPGVSPTTTAAPAVQSPPEVPLPTVTPTLEVARVATRTLEITGQATLRLALSNEEFKSGGRPLPLELEPRTFVLGADKPVIEDRWCVQAGVSALFFDLTMELNPRTAAIGVNGEIQMHDGFCESPGAQRAVSPVALQVPADAKAEVVHSLQANSNLLGNLFETSTGVFLELTLRNPRIR